VLEAALLGDRDVPQEVLAQSLVLLERASGIASDSLLAALRQASAQE
jgi:hypothetical protein